MLGFVFIDKCNSDHSLNVKRRETDYKYGVNAIKKLVFIKLILCSKTKNSPHCSIKRDEAYLYAKHYIKSI